MMFLLPPRHYAERAATSRRIPQLHPVLANRPGLVRALAVAAMLVAFIAASRTGVGVLLRVQGNIVRRTVGLARGMSTFEADRTYRPELGRPVRLLLAGDSVAAGFGAAKRKHTLGVRLAKGVARRTGRSVELLSVAVVGAESTMLAAQLDGLPPAYRPDVALIVIGGNDVAHRVKPGQAAADLGAAVGRLRGLGAEVVVGTCPDLGTLPAVPQPLRRLGGRASHRLAAAQQKAVLAAGGRPVPLGGAVAALFLARPVEMFAQDKFHPSSLGYRRSAEALLPAVVKAVQATAVPGHAGRRRRTRHRIVVMPPLPSGSQPGTA
ncbi:MAG: family lipase [Micrococcaceae bacterium]|nr:family lipase [Micrococcaceae bacterium]